MLNEELRDKLAETLAICDLHHKRMMFAWENIGRYFPLDHAKDWISLRQTRNTVSHEYPFYKEIQIEELNLLPEEVEKLAGIWTKLKEYTILRLDL